MNTLNRRRGGENHKNQTYTINHSSQEQPSWAKQAAPLNPELTGKYDKKLQKKSFVAVPKCNYSIKITGKFPDILY